MRPVSRTAREAGAPAAPGVAALARAAAGGTAPSRCATGERGPREGVFGDIGRRRRVRNGEGIGQTGYRTGGFETPAEDGSYELSPTQTKIGQPAAVGKRSTQALTTLASVAPRDGQRITLGVVGRAGHQPGAPTVAEPSCSHGGGAARAEPVTQRSHGARSATADRTDAACGPAGPQAEPTDAQGGSVTQLVIGAYAVR